LRHLATELPRNGERTIAALPHPCLPRHPIVSLTQHRPAIDVRSQHGTTCRQHAGNRETPRRKVSDIRFTVDCWFRPAPHNVNNGEAEYHHQIGVKRENRWHASMAARMPFSM
jgi:hypothetical protein